MNASDLLAVIPVVGTFQILLYEYIRVDLSQWKHSLAEVRVLQNNFMVTSYTVKRLIFLHKFESLLPRIA